MIRLLWLDSVIRRNLKVLLPIGLISGLLLARSTPPNTLQRLGFVIGLAAAISCYAIVWSILLGRPLRQQLRWFELALPITGFRLWLLRLVLRQLSSALPPLAALSLPVLTGWPWQVVFPLAVLAMTMPLVVLLHYLPAPHATELADSARSLIIGIASLGLVISLTIAFGVGGLWLLVPISVCGLSTALMAALVIRAAQGIELSSGQTWSRSWKTIFTAQQPPVVAPSDARPSSRIADPTWTDAAGSEGSGVSESRGSTGSTASPSAARALARYLGMQYRFLPIFLFVLGFLCISRNSQTALSYSVITGIFIILLTSKIDLVFHLPITRSNLLRKLCLPSVFSFLAGAVIAASFAAAGGSDGKEIKLELTPGSRKVVIPRELWRLELASDGRPGPETSVQSYSVPGLSCNLINPVAIPPDASDEQLAQALHQAVLLVYGTSVPVEALRPQHLEHGFTAIAASWQLRPPIARTLTRTLIIMVVGVGLMTVAGMSLQRNLTWIRVVAGVLLLLPFGISLATFQPGATILPAVLLDEAVPSNPALMVLMVVVTCLAAYQAVAWAAVRSELYRSTTEQRQC